MTPRSATFRFRWRPTHGRSRTARTGLAARYPNVFFEHVTEVRRTSFLQSGAAESKTVRHWLTQSMAFRRAPLLPVRHVPSSPGQKMLPGMEAE